MAWRGPHPMLLLVLLATWLALAWGEKKKEEETPFAMFKRQHVADPRTDKQSDNEYCKSMMRFGRMTRDKRKPSNTFIHVNNVNTIIDVCDRGGTPVVGDRRDSKARFNLTFCKLRDRLPTEDPKSYYYNGSTYYRRIRIECLWGRPSHFVESIYPDPQS